MTLHNNLSVIDSLTWESEERQGGLSPCILKNIAKKVVFLVSSGKKQISPLLALPLEKFWINPLVSPLKKSFRRPCSLTNFTAQMEGCETCSRTVLPLVLLRKNDTAINLQTFTLNYGSRLFTHVTRASRPVGGFSTQFCFLVDLGVWVYEKSRQVWVFWIDKFISNFNVFSNIKITLYYSVCISTSGEKVRISVEAGRVQSVSYPHIRSLSGLYIYLILLSLMPTEGTGETSVRTDCSNFDVSQCIQIKKKFN